MTIEEKVQDPDTDLDVSTAPPKKKEIMAAIRSLRNGKAYELFKAETEFAAQVLQPLFAAMWGEKQLPDDWTEGVIMKNPKKGALSNCNNWRGVTVERRKYPQTGVQTGLQMIPNGKWSPM